MKLLWGFAVVGFLIATGTFNTVFSTESSTSNIRVISDIDDTVQYTSVHPGLSFFKFAIHLFHNYDSFVGIVPLFHAFSHSGIEIDFVSGAPGWVSSFGRRFLESSGFPRSREFYRGSFKDSLEDFKVTKIREIILAHPEARFILLGDNSERDTFAFKRIQEDPELAPRIESIFVHRMYGEKVGQPIFAGQTFFLTAAEIAADLFNRGILTEAMALSTMQIVDRGLKSRRASIRDRTLPFFIRPSSLEIQGLKSRLLETTSPKIRSVGGEIFESILARRSRWDRCLGYVKRFVLI